MRLLQRKGHGRYDLVERVGENIPPYAILSHTWGQDEEEPTFKDIENGTGENKAGYRKILFCGEQAAKDDLEYFWVDTCCIDKSSSSELQEAINSMFDWYRRAAKCYVYLSDVSTNEFDDITLSLRKSIWFTRGWTLQELIAPSCVEFFSSDGNKFGNKTTIAQEIYEITSIPVSALRGDPITQFSIGQRLSWAEDRQTKRPEDSAYCLLGIFDIQMPLIYGEGRTKAFSRLVRKIMKSHVHGAPDAFALQLLTKPPQVEWTSLLPGLSTHGTTGFSQPTVSPILSRYMDHLGDVKMPSNFEDALVLENVALDRMSLEPEPKMRPAGPGNMELEKRHDFSYAGQGLDDLLNQILSSERLSVDIYESMRKQTHYFEESRNDAKNTIAEPSLRSAEQKIGVLSQLPVGSKVQDQHTQVGNRVVQRLTQNLLHITYQKQSLVKSLISEWLDVNKDNDQYMVLQSYNKQISLRLEGTCEWIFTHYIYRHWISHAAKDHSTRILWLYGPAGHGKTVLCAKIIEHLQKSTSLLVAYSFVSSSSQSKDDMDFIVRSWILQLMRLDEGVFAYVRGQFKADRRLSSDDIWFLFQAIIAQTAHVALILDGLDEFDRQDDQRTQFLERLKTAAHGTASRILITSRFGTDIEAGLTQEPEQEKGLIVLKHRITQENLQDDISKFSKHIVDEKLPTKDDELKSDLARQLTEKSEGMFLWVKLQKDQLRAGKNAIQLQRAVRNMPIGLKQTYEQNWRVISNQHTVDRDRALAILKWTAFSFRPLNVLEITEALVVECTEDGCVPRMDELPDVIDEDYVNGEIINICGGLVEVRAPQLGGMAGSRIVTPTHSTVKEYLLAILAENSSDMVASSSIPEQTTIQAKLHGYLASICIGFLNCDASWSKSEDPELRDDFIDYAAKNWMNHAAAANKADDRMLSEIDRFLRQDNGCFKKWSTYFETSRHIVNERKGLLWGSGSPLYYAALFNLITTMQRIWAADTSQRAIVGGEYGTPLQAACFQGHQAIFQQLINWDVNPDAVAGRFGIALNAAIVGGHKAMIKALIARGVDLTLKDPMGRTPLYTAARQGDKDILSCLISAKADKEMINRYGWTPINAAASHGHLEAVKLLLEHDVNITVRNENGSAPLYTAASEGHLEIVELLLEKGADITAVNENGWTPLFGASVNGHLNLVTLLLDNGADMGVTDDNGGTPLNGAAANGHVEIVKLLLKRGADLTATSNDGWTPLHAASTNGHLEVVKLLLERGADVTASTNAGSGAINLAASNGHMDIVSLLLDRGAEFDTTSKNGWTPLNGAASEGHTEVVRLLLDKGADIAAVNSNGWTPLNSAASEGHLEVVRLLLEKGADMTVANKDGWTPLNGAASEGHLDVVELLLDHNADMTVTNINGWTPLNVAATNGYLEVTRLLLDRGADFAATSNDRWTPLHGASSNGHLDIVKLLIERGVDITALTKAQSAALNLASGNGHINIVKLLLEKGSDMAITNSNGWTPLHSAASEGEIDIVRLLLDKGADTTVTNNEGWTPLMMAATDGNVEIVRLLLDRGADIAATGSAEWTPLRGAAGNGHLEVVKLLLEKGADLAAASSNGWVPLHSASANGHLEVVRLLLERGANPDSTSNNGWTPLYNASSNGHLEVVRMLIEQGADIAATKSDGWSLLNVAATKGHPEVVRLLLERGAEFVTISNDGWTPLRGAASNGHLEVARLLLDRGADLAAASSSSWAPLHSASANGHLEVVKLLLDRGADISATSYDGWSSLGLAADNGHVEVAKLLLDRGATPLVFNESGWTPLDSAAEGGHIEVINLLLEQDAYGAVDNIKSPYGTVASTFAYKGYTDILRSIVDHNSANIHAADSHGRTTLQLAARGGHLETFKYLMSHGLTVTSLDAKGHGLIDYAASSGSPEVLNAVLDLGLGYASRTGYWSPLHWACRAGNAQVVDLLIENNWECESVRVPELEGEWTPLAIAILHSNEAMLADLSQRSQDVLGTSEVDACIKGEFHGGAWCNGCFHTIYGPRFRCRSCVDFDYCAMCKHFLEHLHGDHDWECMKSPAESQEP